MPRPVAQPPAVYLAVAVTDFAQGVRSVEMGLADAFEPLSLARCAIHVVIDAPAAYEAEGQYVFFVEPFDKGRVLAANQFKLMYEGEPGDRCGFLQWAARCATFFQRMLFHIGMVCVDYADFRTALDACRTKTLRFEYLAYDRYDVVPYLKHQGPPYRVIYGCLCGEVDTSLQQWLAFSAAVHAHNPALVMDKLALTVGSYAPPVMMLLGEAVVG